MQQSTRKNFDVMHVPSGLCIGTDEVGRGPLAGPVVAAAVLMPPDWDHPDIRDSKKINHQKRIQLAELIKISAFAYQIIAVDPAQIDQINILQASLLAMKTCVLNLQSEIVKNNFWGMLSKEVCVLVDGNQKIPSCPYLQQTIIGGDDKSLSIAAASILAKVYRDQLMTEFDFRYPNYGFAQNKGYGTELHRTALLKHGPTPIHRKTFLGKILNAQLSTC